MATTSLLSVEEYLKTSYEPDAEYVDGVIEERPMGEWNHSAWQATLTAFFFMHSDEWHIRVRPEQRTKTGERRYRIPDIAVFDADTAPDPVALVPPLIAFEILSPEDRVSRLRVRLADFKVMGVPEICIVDPEDGALMRFVDGGLHAASEVRLRSEVVDWQRIAETLR